MTENEGINQALEALDDVRIHSPAAEERTKAAALSDEPLTRHRVAWLRSVLGLTDSASRNATKHELAARNKSEVPAMMLVVHGLGRVVNHEPLREELYRFRMYLNGEDDRAIAAAFRKTPGFVCEERLSFVDRLNGEGDFDLASEVRAKVAEARKRAIGDILGSHALEKVFGRGELRRMTAAAGQLEPDWKIHEPDFIVGRIEQAMEQKGMITPGLGLLSKHFLDTERELPGPLRNEISPALRGLSSIVKNETIAAASHGEPVESYCGLRKSLDFLRMFIDHEGGAVPPGRSAYMEQWQKANPDKSDDEAAAQIKDDNDKLALALSWVFDTERKAEW